MDDRQTRVRTSHGVLVVTRDHVQLERGPVKSWTRRVPREAITHARLVSRFRRTPLVVGVLLLGASVVSLWVSVSPSVSLPVPSGLLQSLALVLLVASGLFLLSLPLGWRAVLEVGSNNERIRVHTGYRRRDRLEAALAHLQEPCRDVDLVKKGGF